MVEGSGQILDDQAVVFGQALFLGLGDFPARHVIMEAILDGQVEDRVERLEEVVLPRIYDRLNRVVDVTEKDHTGIGGHASVAAREIAVRHVLLHDHEGLAVLDHDTFAHFIESDHIPKAD